jgi:hypothetical protein
MTQRIGGFLKMPLPLLCTRFLKPCGIGFGIEFQRFLRILESFRRLPSAIVVSAQVYMSAYELSVTLIVKGNSFLISLKRCGIIA